MLMLTTPSPLQASKVEFKPSIVGDAGLTQTVNVVSKEAIATTAAMPRLADILLAAEAAGAGGAEHVVV